MLRRKVNTLINELNLSKVVVILAGANDLPYSDEDTATKDLQELCEKIRSYNPRNLRVLFVAILILTTTVVCQEGDTDHKEKVVNIQPTETIIETTQTLFDHTLDTQTLVQVVNIQPTETIIETTQTLFDHTLDTQTLVQASKFPSVELPDIQTERETPVLEPTETYSTLIEASGTSLEEDKSLEPSFVDSYISEVETIQQSESSLETPDVPYSNDVRQSDDASTEQPSEEKIIDKEIDKSIPIAHEETPLPEVKDQSEPDPEIIDEKPQKIDPVELPGDEGTTSDGQAEQGTPLTETTHKEEETTGEDKKQIDTVVEDKPAEKPDEEGLTFNEWAQKVLAEEEKEKHHAKTENLAVSSTKQRKKKNYALQECGAKILASNPEATNAKSVLNPNKDDYMINPCKVKKWFVVELCEPMQAFHVEMASLELFSSQPKSFKIYLSDRYPTKEWRFAGQDELTEERVIQTFDIDESVGYFAKFVRVELLDHYGNEHFCPLTMFRLFGLDYDISDSEEDEQEQGQDDDDLVSDEEDGEDSKNLFSSAKDKVLEIVKSVLNVEDNAEDGQQHSNETTESFSKEINVGDNKTLTAPVNDGGHACPGDGRTPGAGETPKTDSSGQKLDTTNNGQTNDVKLVVKIEDHEQIETGSQPVPGDTKEGDPTQTLQSKIDNCFSCSNTTQTLSLLNSIPVTQMCIYIKFLLDKYKAQTCSLPIHTVKTESEQQLEDSQSRTSLQSSEQTASRQSSEDSSTKMLESDTQSSTVELSKSSAIQNNISVEQPLLVSSTDSTIDSADETSADKTSADKTSADTTSAEIVTGSETTTTGEILPEHTKVTAESATADFDAREPLTPTQTVLVLQSDIVGSSIKTDTSVVSESSVINVAGERIEPSPTLVDSLETSSASREATPSLSETGSVMLDKDVVTETSTETGMHSDQSSTETIVQDSVPTIVTESSVGPSISVAIEPSSIEQQQEVTVRDPPELEIQDMKLPHTTDDSVSDQTAETVEDKSIIKPVVDGSKQKELNLVKVPLVPFSKRESAIMRLNNRIKVLEQNVSLSTRYLEELSKRYKKQSEDMMKMLNRTVARLNNATLEAEIKDKLHDDAIGIMESQLHNLSATVTELTVKLDVLNKQVTDRQMIWTSIEIIVIMIIMIIMLRRGKTNTLSPEIKQMIASMPTQPAPSSYRRNSLSGPATPLKSKSDLDPGPKLQRFCSEATLVHCDYPVIEPGNSPFFTPQTKDGSKKKKKKKHKNPDSRFLVGMKESNSDVGLKVESLSQTSASSINSAGVLFRSENIGPSLPKLDVLSCEKLSVDSTRSRRSDSSVSCSSSGTSIASSEFSICDKSSSILNRKVGKFSSTGQSSGFSIGAVGGKKHKTSPTLPRNDKNSIKTHKRQKSLPITSERRPSVQTVGKIETQDSYEKFNVEKGNQAQQVVSKPKQPGVRKSSSMTSASKGTRFTVSEKGFANQSKIGKGSQKVHNTTTITNGFTESTRLEHNGSNWTFDGTSATTINVHGHYNGVGVNGSKSCSHIDPGGTYYIEEVNGYEVDDQHYMNGHSFNELSSCSNENIGLALHSSHKQENPTTKSGWRKLIGWV